MQKDYKQIAMEYFKDGHNCCQAVLLAFSDQTGLDKEISLKIASSFGGGMGRMRLVCGAASGMFMVAGMCKGYTDQSTAAEKTEHYRLIQTMANDFIEENGSIICAELLAGVSKTNGVAPEARTQEYYKKRPCAELVGCAAEIVCKRVLLDK